MKIIKYKNGTVENSYIHLKKFGIKLTISKFLAKEKSKGHWVIIEKNTNICLLFASLKKTKEQIIKKFIISVLKNKKRFKLLNDRIKNKTQTLKGFPLIWSS